MFVDYTDIYIKSGNGGNGQVSFYRAKSVPNGGPDGGDGGKGGDIVFLADKGLTTLVDYKFKKHFRADNGENGGKNNKKGKCGLDVIIVVPVGTIVRDKESGRIIADMFNDKQRTIVQKGGRGGRGNATFANAVRQSPRFAQNGVITEEKHILLELKVIADVGFIGFPNVGKSTLLAALTSATPKIANYHFTTLSPNLGVLKYYNKTLVIADIPGLIEGASNGSGLGHYFLRHIERVRCLVHIVDISGSEERSAIDDYFKIRKELELYMKELIDIPELLVANKVDILEDRNEIDKLSIATKKEVIPISAMRRENLESLIKKLFELTDSLPKVEPTHFEPFSYEEDDYSEFEVAKISEGVYEVTGGAVKMLARNVVFSDQISLHYFQKKLIELGIIAALKELGIRDGDTIKLQDVEFEYLD